MIFNLYIHSCSFLNDFEVASSNLVLVQEFFFGRNRHWFAQLVLDVTQFKNGIYN